MKKLIIILDGALDEFYKNQTPLMIANIRNINALVKRGTPFRLKTVLDGEDINSKNANMTILGVKNRLSVPGRPVLEALSLGLNLPIGVYVYRLNLLSLDEDDNVVSTVGSGVLPAEHLVIKATLEKFLKPMQIAIYDVSEHAFLLVSLAPLGGLASSNITGLTYANLLRNQPKHLTFIRQIEDILNALDLNEQRCAAAKPKINSVLIWGESTVTKGETIVNQNSAVISATPVVQALARYNGYSLYTKTEFTGDALSDFTAKAQLSLELLKTYDTVFCHIDGLDYVSHKRERSKKTELLERIDKDYFGTLCLGLPKLDDVVELSVLPDHGTSSLTGSHIYSVVPGFSVIYGSEKNNVFNFDENTAKNEPILSPTAWRDFLLQGNHSS